MHLVNEWHRHVHICLYNETKQQNNASEPEWQNSTWNISQHMCILYTCRCTSLVTKGQMAYYKLKYILTCKTVKRTHVNYSYIYIHVKWHSSISTHVLYMTLTISTIYCGYLYVSLTFSAHAQEGGGTCLVYACAYVPVYYHSSVYIICFNTQSMVFTATTYRLFLILNWENFPFESHKKALCKEL